MVKSYLFSFIEKLFCTKILSNGDHFIFNRNYFVVFWKAAVAVCFIFLLCLCCCLDGIKFYRSANNVILSPGDERGTLLPKYFANAVQRQPRKLNFSKFLKKYFYQQTQVAFRLLSQLSVNFKI